MRLTGARLGPWLGSHGWQVSEPRFDSGYFWLKCLVVSILSRPDMRGSCYHCGQQPSQGLGLSSLLPPVFIDGPGEGGQCPGAVPLPPPGSSHPMKLLLGWEHAVPQRHQASLSTCCICHCPHCTRPLETSAPIASGETSVFAISIPGCIFRNCCLLAG